MATIRDLWLESQANRKKREEEAARLEQMRDGRATKKTAATEAAAKLAADFERCPGKGKCSCGALPCPMEKYELCQHCPQPVPKLGKCKVRACVEARKRAEQPLLLMGPAEQPYALTGPM